MNRFLDVYLRTLDVDAAKEFYRGVLGAAPTKVVRLHEHALLRGARPHWLGLLDAGDLDRASARFVERGASRLSQKLTNPDGLEVAVFRDPGGAVVALAKPPAARRPEPADEPAAPEIVFHSLNTADVARAMATYAELFGWDFRSPVDLGRLGTFHPFAWATGAPDVGVFSDVAGRPEVHAHWTFHFRVPELDAAVGRVRSLGGLALDPIALPSGDRVAVCDDPQGAAFALHETSRGA